jgi:CRISPR-associated endoribonuclease Cas6
MRCNFSTTPSLQELSINDVHLRGFVNKCLIPIGEIENSLHDQLSNYSVSNLDGSKLTKKNTVVFRYGARFFFSSPDPTLTKKVAQSAIMQPELFAGMVITDIQIQPTPQFPDSMRFSVASPVLVKKFDGKTIHHLTFNDPEASDVMTRTMQTKLRAAGLDAHAETVRVRFDTSYSGAKTKLVDIHGIKNRANVCPVIVEGTPEAVAFAWDVGVGHSTGAGFGALR